MDPWTWPSSRKAASATRPSYQRFRSMMVSSRECSAYLKLFTYRSLHLAGARALVIPCCTCCISFERAFVGLFRERAGAVQPSARTISDAGISGWAEVGIVFGQNMRCLDLCIEGGLARTQTGLRNVFLRLFLLLARSNAMFKCCGYAGFVDWVVAFWQRRHLYCDLDGYESQLIWCSVHVL